MTYKQLTNLTTFVLCISSLSLHGMQLPKDKVSFLQDAPITDWKQNPSIYNNAYQGAQYDFSDKKAYEHHLAGAQKEEQGTIKDWVYAAQQVETTFLNKPFETWTLEDIQQISAWLNRSTVDKPGVLRVQAAAWFFRDLDNEEAVHIDQLATRMNLSSETQEAIAMLRSNPLLQKNPMLLQPLTSDEKALLKRSAYIFPLGSAIGEELHASLRATQKRLSALKSLSWEQRQQEALSLGCTFHYDIVRIHPFIEGSKRLGRLCMFIIHAQNGIRPLTIENAEEYKQSLIDCLATSSPKPFEKYFRETLNSKESQKLTQDVPLSLCAYCGKKGKELQRCGRCKTVYYCDRDCQTKDWKAGHKSTCTSAKK